MFTEPKKNDSYVGSLKSKVALACGSFSMLPIMVLIGFQLLSGQDLGSTINLIFIAACISTSVLSTVTVQSLLRKQDLKIGQALTDCATNPLSEMLKKQMPGAYALLEKNRLSDIRISELEIKLHEARQEVEAGESRMQRALKQARIDSERSKLEVISGLGHDLKQPLYASSMALANMQRSQAYKDNPSLKAHANRIEEGLRRASNHINEISRVSNAGSLSSALTMAPMDIYREVESIHAHLSVTAFAKGLYADFIVDTHVPNMVISSSNAIRYMVQNVFDNAIKFTNSGGVTLRISVEKIISSSEFMLGITVNDTGSGLSREQIDAIVSRFEHSGGAISLMGGGNGLGLDIAMTYLKGLGGALDIQSSEAGTSIKAVIPVKRANQTAGIEQSVCASILNAMQVSFFVLDGRESFRSSMASRLENMGATCFKSSSLSEIEDQIKASDKSPIVILRRKHSEETKAIIGSLSKIRDLDPALIISMEKSTEDLDSYVGRSDDTADVVVNAGIQISPLLEIVRQHVAPSESSLHDIFLDQSISLEQSTLKGMSILLIDDDQTNLEHTADYLRSYGAKVEIGLGPDKGVNLACNKAYDVIFVDMKMPGTNGIEAAFMIRGGLPNKETPIFAFTAASLTEKELLDITNLDMKVLDKSDAINSIVMLIKTAHMKSQSTKLTDGERPARRLRSVR